MPSTNPPPTEFESASLGQRVAAQLIDISLTMGLLALAAFAPSIDGLPPFAVPSVFLLLAVGYRLFADGLWSGAAVGKRLLGIYIVDSKTRQPSSVMQCLVRASVWIIPFFYLIEWIILYSDGQQRYGDRLAGTYVLRRNPKVAPAPAPLRPVDYTAIRNSIRRSNDEQGSSR